MLVKKNKCKNCNVKGVGEFLAADDHLIENSLSFQVFEKENVQAKII